MADAWLPGAARMYSGQDEGAMKGGAPRAVWHTSEHDPCAVSAHSVAQRLGHQGRCAHLVWNPDSGEIVQMVPATLAARMLPEGVGREGRACIQVIVVGRAREPFTDAPCGGLDRIVTWLDMWGVPRRWPAGPPLPPPQAYHAVRSRRAWAGGGHFGTSQVPGAHEAAPGAIDVHLITGPDPAIGIPRQRLAEAGDHLARPDELLTRRLPPETVRAHAGATSGS